MSKHTEGKLKAVVVEGSLLLVNDDESKVINTIALLADAREGDANRLAACWNAFVGRSPKWEEAFDNLQAKLDDTLNLLEIAIAERDKERAVKKELLKACKKLLETGGDGPDIDKSDEAYTLAEQAIASAEKEGNNETHKKSE